MLLLRDTQLKEDGIHVTAHKTEHSSGASRIIGWNDVLRAGVQEALDARPSRNSVKASFITSGVHLHTWASCPTVAMIFPRPRLAHSESSRSSGERQAFIRLLGSSAIYAINLVTEDVARAAAANFRPEPLHPFDLPQLRQQSLAMDPVDMEDDGRKPDRVKPTK